TNDQPGETMRTTPQFMSSSVGMRKSMLARAAMKLTTTSLFRQFCPDVLFAALVMGQTSALAAVNYVPGDFNGDGISDVIIVNAFGSFEYLGVTGGGFTPNVWVRGDLPLGQVQYFPGD